MNNYDLFKISKMTKYYDLFKLSKNECFFDLFKVSKNDCFLTCSKLAVLNKTIQGTFLSLKIIKIDSKDTIFYLLEKSSDK